MKSNRIKASLESENAELRDRVKMLEAVVHRLLVPQPPQPTVNLDPGCAPFLGGEPFVWNAGSGAIGTH